MNTSLSRKQQFFNKIKLTADDDLYIGIDVHKKSYHLALYLNDTHAIDFVMPPDNSKIIQMLSTVKIAIRNIVYEAGPTGFSLARALLENKFPVSVIAPSKTPIQAATASKTDRLDCRKLAQYAAKGLLRPIAIPTKTQEAQRQLVRLRQQFIYKFSRTKIQIKSFLLQHGIPQPQGLSIWTDISIDNLKTLNINQHLRYCLDSLIENYEFLKTKIKDINSRLKQHLDKGPLEQKIKLLRTHPGIGEVIARQFAVEIFNPKRFKNPCELAKFVGLAPTVIQSGQSMRDGPITKTGRPDLRANLVEAAWVWIRKDSHAYKTYNRIRINTGHQNKAITAMARRLAVHLWKMSVDMTAYRQIG
jgi:transposase